MFTAVDMDYSEKYRALKDIVNKVNEKVQVLELKIQGSLSIDLNTRENYYEQLTKRFQNVRDLIDVEERDILAEIEQKIDLNKEEQFIEDFI